jgi:HEAT repeat protein
MTSLGCSAPSYPSYYARTRNSALLIAMLFLACAPSYTRAQAPASGDPVQDLMRRDKAVHDNAERLLLAEGPQALPRLLAATRGQGTRDAVIRLALKMGAPAVPALIDLLGDEALRMKAGSLLFTVIGSASADQAPALIDCVASKPEVKNYCGTSLVKAMSPQASAQVPALRKALASPDADLRAYAAAALAQVGAAARPGAPELAGLLKDAEPRVRLTAAQALGKLGGKSIAVRKALEDLAGRKSETPEIRRQAKLALRRWHA